MTDPSAALPRAFLATVIFTSGGQPFAAEQYPLDAANAEAAAALADRLSADSVYLNPRIPDLDRQVSVVPAAQAPDG